MSLFPLILSSSVVSFSSIVLVDYLIFRVAWSTAVIEALVATVLGHLLALLWLYWLGKG